MLRSRHLSFYSPGLISAVFIPIFLWYFSSKYSKTLIQGGINVFWFDPELPKNYPDLILRSLPPKRNYVTITLTGNNQADRIKLAFSQVRLREILMQKDSVNGIKYHFDETAEYWSLIKALDICEIEGAKTFVPYDSDLWVYHIPEDTSTTIEPLFCGTSDYLQQLSSDNPAKHPVTIEWLILTPVFLGTAFLTFLSLRKLIISRRQLTWGWQKQG